MQTKAVDFSGSVTGLGSGAQSERGGRAAGAKRGCVAEVREKHGDAWAIVPQIPIFRVFFWLFVWASFPPVTLVSVLWVWFKKGKPKDLICGPPRGYEGSPSLEDHDCWKQAVTETTDVACVCLSRLITAGCKPRTSSLFRPKKG